MAETLFPKRTRCKNCRKGLNGTPVVDGLFCSYRCAGLPIPSTKVEDAPRWCKRMAGVKWEFKKRFLYELEVPQRLRNDPNTNIYRCDYCHNLHVGHNTPIDAKDTKLHRAVIDLSQTGSVIKRHRESKKIDKKSLAKKMKIPAMRITEIEEGKKEARADILFDLLRELRLIVELKSKS